jgi:hypothetical protein
MSDKASATVFVSRSIKSVPSSVAAAKRIDVSDEPDHNALCEREQRYLLKAIDEDIDLTNHMNDAVKSLKIVVAADQSIHIGQVVTL